MEHVLEECSLCDIDQLMSDYRSNRMSSKTFSLLLAEKIGLRVMPGFALFVENGQIVRCVALNSESRKISLKDDERYLIRYDFLHRSENLYEWLSERSARPESCTCNGKELKRKLSKLIKKSDAFRTEFIVLLQNAPSYTLLGHTVIDEKGIMFTEISDDPLMSHGKGSIQFFIHDRELIECKSVYPLRDQVASISSTVYDMMTRFQPFIGDCIDAEWFICRGQIYISHVRPSYPQAFPSSAVSLSAKKKETEIHIVSSGSCEGYLKPVPASRKGVQELVQLCLKHQKKFIFLAKRPLSNLVPLIPFAKGFIFREGSLLCHFAILLRESKIPAIIFTGNKSKIKMSARVRVEIKNSCVRFVAYAQNSVDYIPSIGREA